MPVAMHWIMKNTVATRPNRETATLVGVAVFCDALLRPGSSTGGGQRH
jgi:hypothetical protein